MKIEKVTPKTNTIDNDKASPKEDNSLSSPLPEASKSAEVPARPNGLDPTRYGDWEKNGRCIDF